MYIRFRFGRVTLLSVTPPTEHPSGHSCPETTERTSPQPADTQWATRPTGSLSREVPGERCKWDTTASYATSSFDAWRFGMALRKENRNVSRRSRSSNGARETLPDKSEGNCVFRNCSEELRNGDWFSFDALYMISCLE